MHVVETEGLTKVYPGAKRGRRIVALEDVSVHVEAAEIVGLLGPNGAGKTTFFKSILGITHASAGKIRVNGLPVSNPQSRARLGYLPENHRFPAHLSGRQLISLAGRMEGVNATEMSRRTDELLELVDMTRWGDTPLKKYSKGMAQRIGLAQAMINDPELLLLDEPTDGVDPVGKVEIRKILERIRSEGKAIVLNSHLLAEVESVADRVVILQHGRVARMSSIEELVAQGIRYEIEASIGERLFKIPEDIGKIVSVSSNWMIVDLENEEGINFIIDQLRTMKISIKQVKRMRQTLEQSFMELVTAGQRAISEAKEERP